MSKEDWKDWGLLVLWMLSFLAISVAVLYFVPVICWLFNVGMD